ncbi:MAG: FAD:protein FMN transferase [Vicinamibacteria bacterium]|nr:FAD:protein FMN transferase [Vicinamibacteria bacterium]
MSATRRHSWIAIVMLAILAAVAGRRIRRLPETSRQPLSSRPNRIMGTECLLLAVPFTRAQSERDRAEQALRNAETALRRVESQMSRRIDASPIARLNRAPAGTYVPLPDDLMTVLRASREIHAASRGSFDVTISPLIALWRAAADAGVSPDPDRIHSARRRSSWDHLTLLEHGVLKSAGAACMDLGGIAKGHGIDLAIESMKRSAVAGGLVEVGGDLRVFGEPPSARQWKIDIRSPFHMDSVLLSIRIDEGAVCTSGDYFRYTEIDGRRYSHIVDPRSGWPAREAHSSTVFAYSAMMADAWATALSVLGPSGLELLPAGMEGLVVTGKQGSPRLFTTNGLVFRIHPLELRASIEVVRRSGAIDSYARTL